MNHFVAMIRFIRILSCLFCYFLIGRCQTILDNVKSLGCEITKTEDPQLSDTTMSMEEKVRCSYEIAKRRLARRKEREDTPIKAPESCLTVDAFYVSRKFQESKSRAQEMNEIQKVFEETTKILNKKYGVGLSQLPSQEFLLHTVMADSVKNCMKFFSNIPCPSMDKYRTIDGSCNNKDNPTWGMSSTCFRRLIPAVYADGISAIRKAVSGKDLPNARKLSVTLHNDKDVPDELLTHLFMQFAQIVAHDISASPVGIKRFVPVDCCSFSRSNPECVQIPVDKSDPFYPKHGINCLSAIRIIKCPTCNLGARQQTHQSTAYLDGSVIYGARDGLNEALRNNDGTGTLKSSYIDGVGEVLPPSQHRQTDACSFQSKRPNVTCPEIGDSRGNMHHAITALHTLFIREHNRIARFFYKKKKSWGEEKIFQEARRLLIAELQMITFTQYLPHLLGLSRMEKENLVVQKDLSYTQYNYTANPMLITEFSIAAFRYAHSLISSNFPEIPNKTSSSIYLRDNYNQPFGLYKGELDGLVFGMTQSPCQAFDRHVTKDVTNHLYEVHGEGYGLDLVVLDIIRGRDRGLPPYVQMLRFCGGPDITSFDQLNTVFRKGYVKLYEKAYESVQDIDLFSGGLAEEPTDGGAVGITFACIISEQFRNIKFGDRFYFEHGGQAESFTLDQLREIKKSSLAKIICDNSGIDMLQENPLLKPSNRNPFRSCEQHPSVDLSVFLH